MSKLTKPQIRQHEAALELLKHDRLEYSEKLFIMANYRPDATHTVSKAGAFFTPLGLARDFRIECQTSGRVIDLCAGIGILSFFVAEWNPDIELTCVEVNPEYLAIGKKLLPQANWILADVRDPSVLELGRYSLAISNPPFGNISGTTNFEYAVIEIASKLAVDGVFILPQMSTPFKYSGNDRNGAKYFHSEKYEKFKERTGIEFEFNCGIDTGLYQQDWMGVSPMCEIVLTDFRPFIDSATGRTRAGSNAESLVDAVEISNEPGTRQLTFNFK